MSDDKKLIDDSPIPDTPVLPNQLAGDAVIQFRCHKDIDCFNACCKNIDIMLTPYDILRLKKRLGITSTEFLRQYTEPFEFGRGSVGGVKYTIKDGIIYDARELLADVARMVEKQKMERKATEN